MYVCTIGHSATYKREDLHASAFALYMLFLSIHMLSATLPARAANAARVSRRLLVRLHICRATLEARFARAPRVWMRAHLFFSMVRATFPARRHSSSAILLLCVHFTHLLCRPTSAAWHFLNALRNHTLLLPCAFVHSTFLILRSFERMTILSVHCLASCLALAAYCCSTIDTSFLI